MAFWNVFGSRLQGAPGSLRRARGEIDVTRAAAPLEGVPFDAPRAGMCWHLVDEARRDEILHHVSDRSAWLPTALAYAGGSPFLFHPSAHVGLAGRGARAYVIIEDAALGTLGYRTSATGGVMVDMRPFAVDAITFAAPFEALLDGFGYEAASGHAVGWRVDEMNPSRSTGRVTLYDVAVLLRHLQPG